SEMYVKSLSSMMIISIILSIIYIIAGLFLAYWYDLSTGASVILVAVLGTIILYMVKWSKN
ncbi:metal ABC transporter permease, partial [Hydrogenimonas thermophila]